MQSSQPTARPVKDAARFDGTGVSWIMRDRPERPEFDRIIVGQEQIYTLPEVATKAPPVLPKANQWFDGADSALPI